MGNNKLHVDLMINDDFEIFFVCLFMHTAGLPTPTNHELVYSLNYPTKRKDCTVLSSPFTYIVNSILKRVEKGGRRR